MERIRKDFIEELIEYCNENGITAYMLSRYTKVSPTYCYKLLRREMDNPSNWIANRIEQGLKENQNKIEKRKNKNNE